MTNPTSESKPGPSAPDVPGLRWVRALHELQGGKFMAIGAGDFVYVVGTWHGHDQWQGAKYNKHTGWKVSSKNFLGPTGSTQAREWCEAENRKEESRGRKQ